MRIAFDSSRLHDPKYSEGSWVPLYALYQMAGVGNVGPGDVWFLLRHLKYVDIVYS